MEWQTPKIDWTAPDSLEYSDLNRIESNTLYLAQRLAEVGYPAVLQAVETWRDMETIEFADSLTRLEANIDALHRAFIKLPEYQAAKEWLSGMAFTYEDANRIESNLLVLYVWLGRAIKAFKYCGTFHCGEGGEIY